MSSENFKRHRRAVNKAFRYEIDKQTVGWKEDHVSEIWRGVFCPVTGEKLSRRQAEADHCGTPFQQLVDEFMVSESLLPEQVTTFYDKEKHRYRLASLELRMKWRDYHDKHATLRWISKTGNKIQGDQGYMKRKRETEKGLLKEMSAEKKHRDLYEDDLRFAKRQILDNLKYQ